MATSLPGSESTPPTGAAQPGTPSEPTPLYEVTCNIGNGEHTISEFE
ncbi:MAG: hypothetical protein HN501_04595, partial [Waddliaceae bacterium]|nr:hypothetical protein [Waddliaceae bacterium]